jgi:hypothetical protein
LPPGWLSKVVDVPRAAGELVVAADVLTVVRRTVVREVAVRELAVREVALREAAVRDAVREAGAREAGSGKGPANRVLRGRRSKRSALTTRRVVASKRGLQVVRVSSGVWVASRTAVSEGGTTHWCTTS